LVDAGRITAPGEDRRMSRLLIPALLLAAFSFPVKADPLPEPEGDALFRAGNFREASAWYAGVAGADATLLTAKQREAWAFSRIKLAAEALGQCDAAACEKELAAAISLAPGSVRVQKLGESVLALARRSPTAEAPAATVANGESIETGSFMVKFTGNRELAEKVAAAAEKQRTAVFERWSGPAGKEWTPRCEIVVHATAEEYALATKQLAEGTGYAAVKLAEGKVLERRIDLRADDESLLANALPRELTHVVLADLFPYTPPPKWAEEGMAVLAASPEEVGRYSRTAISCARDGKLFTVATLLDMKDWPAAEKITGFCCGSVSLAEYMVKLKGEKHFTTFLRDCQRYGSTNALKRQYDIDSPKTLQDAWLKAVIK
jgi:hypothetical protein